MNLKYRLREKGRKMKSSIKMRMCDVVVFQMLVGV